MSSNAKYAIIDLETTGGRPNSDRITEIAIFLYDSEKDEVIDSFVSLVNPQVAIPDFITRITGIDNEMVRHAPVFYEVAKRVVEITQDAVFVAHNARFDYGFMQHAFRRLGYTFSRKQLCTIKLSKKSFPDFSSYSLGNLCKYLGIPNEAAHRAWGDAEATLKLFRMILDQEKEADRTDSLSLEIGLNRLPPNLDKGIVDALPDETGVYYFYNKEGEVIYVGKSTGIRKRILSHFQSAHKSSRTLRMIDQIYDVGYELTGSELVALLLENEEIKRLQPSFNRAQKRVKYKFGIFAEEDPSTGYLHFRVDKYQLALNPLAGYASKGQAESALKSRGRKFQLCPKLYGAEKGPGRCFHHHLHVCLGACIGDEDADDYNVRARKAITALSFGRGDMESFLVVGKGRDFEERSVVWVDQGGYRGYSFLPAQKLSEDIHELLSAISPREDLPDVQRIIQGYVKKHPKQVILIPTQS
ncbi:MAG: exonuclease domain-containing protein [Bacteroidota bacterium]